MYITLENTVQPSIEPLGLIEVKDYLRIDSSDEDVLIKALIASVRTIAEKYMRRALITQTWVMYMEDFPRDSSKFIPGFPRLTGRNYIQLPKKPLQSVSSVKYYDTSDTLQTFATTNYIVEKERLYLKDTATWASDVRDGTPVEVTFVCGYGTQETDVPDDIRFALREHVAFLYENRGSTEKGIPTISRAIYDQYKVTSFGRLLG